MYSFNTLAYFDVEKSSIIASKRNWILQPILSSVIKRFVYAG